MEKRKNAKSDRRALRSLITNWIVCVRLTPRSRFLASYCRLAAGRLFFIYNIPYITNTSELYKVAVFYACFRCILIVFRSSLFVSPPLFFSHSLIVFPFSYSFIDIRCFYKINIHYLHIRKKNLGYIFYLHYIDRACSVVASPSKKIRKQNTTPARIVPEIDLATCTQNVQSSRHEQATIACLSLNIALHMSKGRQVRSACSWSLHTS